MTVTISDLKAAGMVVYTTFPLTSPIGPVQKTDGTWRLTVDNHKLNPMVAAITAATSDITLSLEQINTAIDLANTFS